MNIRLQKYKKNRLAGMNQYNAARAAGYSHNYARNAKAERVAKASMADAFEQAGITDQFLIEHAKQGIKACKTVKMDGVEITIEIPEWNVRHKYFETILKLTEKLKDKLELSGQVKVVKMQEITVDDKPLRYRIGQYANQTPGVIALPSEAATDN